MNKIKTLGVNFVIEVRENPGYAAIAAIVGGTLGFFGAMIWEGM